MVHHEADDIVAFISYLHFPTKPSGDFFTIADVYYNGTSIRGEFVNLLVAVRDVGPIKHIHTKTGRDTDCRDIMVFDQTNTGLPISLWNSETISRADNWKPRETVLFLADMRLEWNAFRRGMAASESMCSIVTEDPDIPEAAALRIYARSAPLRPTAILAQLASSIPDPSTINNVMTVQQVLDRADAGSSDNSGGDDSQFTALLYCLLTQYDLDGCSKLTTKKCTQCQLPVEDVCLNLECPIGSGAEIPQYDVIFDLRVSLSDHTGTLENIRLTGITAERIIGYKVDEFVDLPIDVKTQMKWKFLLERCAARVLVLCGTPDRPRPLISLLSCTVADPLEVAACLPVY
ncbi:meiosis-specific with OB domain-containing protein [Periplaneta americana]|uniref:meiosis-specific with OB domain-containing protein n=1 Tax=Periplaneta americana TaxID=6978 RepID=UPI0037E96CC6